MRHDASGSHDGDRIRDRDVTPRLLHLGDMADYQVADGDPDIRGWDVRTADGEKIGKVEDLIIDTGLMKVRYIEASIDKHVIDASDDRRVLIPIGSARLDDDEDDVYLNSSIVDPRTLPPYDRHTLSREYEQTLRDRFHQKGDVRVDAGTEPAVFNDRRAPLADRVSAEDEFYRNDLYDDRRFFGQRRRGREDTRYIGPIDDAGVPPRNERF